MTSAENTSPYSFDAVIFDVDGVITKTAIVHAASWKAMFDEYLRLREKKNGELFKEFTYENDYLPYVDGKPRYKGVQSFLESRGINIDFGDTNDQPGTETVCGLGNQKNVSFTKVLKEKGVKVYQSTVELAMDLKAKGIRIGVASSSKNCQYILQTAKLEGLFETRVDGIVSEELGLQGKPEGDIFVKAAENVEAKPNRSIVVEDAVSGVQAGVNGNFGLVIGVAREDNEADLKLNGADIVVTNFSGITTEVLDKWFRQKKQSRHSDIKSKVGSDTQKESESRPKCREIPVGHKRAPEPADFFKHLNGLKDQLAQKDVFVFLDYDGTLTPIVATPDLAVLSDEMRETVERLSSCYKVSVVSGRATDDVRSKVQIDGIFYAGSHGFEIVDPQGKVEVNEEAQAIRSVIDEVHGKLSARLRDVEGVLVEHVKYTISSHYRLVSDEDFPKVEQAVEGILKEYPGLRKTNGKKVFELRPKIDWHKGKAVEWILNVLKYKPESHTAIYIGDDVTDEDAFAALENKGFGILVADKPRASKALYMVKNTQDVRKVLELLIQIKESGHKS